MADQSDPAAPVPFPALRTFLMGAGGSVLAAAACGFLYAVLSGYPALGSDFAAIVGASAGFIGGFFAGVAVSVRAHSIRVAELSGTASAAFTRKLAAVLFGLGLVLSLSPIILFRTSLLQ